MEEQKSNDERSAAEQGRNERLISYSTVAELTKNIRRNIRHMHRGLEPGEDRDSWLIDYLNHMDTLAQQIETELGCYHYLCARNADTKDS